MQLLQREEDEGGAAGGDCGSKGGWLQPSVARRGERMGDGDAVEGWKAAAIKEEVAIVTDDGCGCGEEVGQRWIRQLQ
ncbi:hypothetical protein GW17_00024365 [Ensete ventricosum]|nr:hypothetical protein GW17_00024365 [Ensete ventricosum]